VNALPHDVAGWITLIIALLSAYLGWKNQKSVNILNGKDALSRSQERSNTSRNSRS